MCLCVFVCVYPCIRVLAATAESLTRPAREAQPRPRRAVSGLVLGAADGDQPV